MADKEKVTGPNPVGGCLFVDGRNPDNNFLFVFRRHGLDGLSAFGNSGLNPRFCGVPHFAPPKNKKEDGRSDRFYKQATLNRVSHYVYLALLILGVAVTCSADELTRASYAAVDSIFSKYCLDCHASKDPEGELVLESFDTLMKGGEIGPAILP